MLAGQDNRLIACCSGVNFYTQNKTTTALWKAEDAIGNKASVDMPTHH